MEKEWVKITFTEEKTGKVLEAFLTTKLGAALLCDDIRSTINQWHDKEGPNA
jgi:hypothetical protein